ncbi:MAG: DUF2807 domain-containing protein [Chitinophagaceae bacterium]
MKYQTCLLFILIAVLISNGCKKPGCIGSAGSIITQERLLPSFNKLRLQDNIDLVLIKSDIEKVEISGPQNIIANVQTSVKEDELTVSNQTDCRWLRDPDEKITARLFLKNISNFEYEGSGNVSNADTLKLESLWINSETGAGNLELTIDMPSIGAIILKENASIKIHGKAENCATYTNARGLLDLSDLQTKKMYMIYSGLADTHIKVSEELDATIRYRGNVYCKGNPVVKRSDYFSSGRLILQP